jgi:hypothetical protein
MEAAMEAATRMEAAVIVAAREAVLQISGLTVYTPSPRPCLAM